MDKVLPDLSLHVGQQSFKKKSRPNGIFVWISIPLPQLVCLRTHGFSARVPPCEVAPFRHVFFVGVFRRRSYPTVAQPRPMLQSKKSLHHSDPDFFSHGRSATTKIFNPDFSFLILIFSPPKPSTPGRRDLGLRPPVFGREHFILLGWEISVSSTPLPPRGPLVTPPGRGQGVWPLTAPKAAG